VEVEREWPKWPERPSKAAWYGLAGQIVGALEQHTEADPSGLLFQLLAGFGNALGPAPHLLVEGARHGGVIFPLLVGPTAIGRKGTAYRHVRRLLEGADPEWARNCQASGLQSGEGIISRVRDPGPAIAGKPGDSGVGEKRLLVLEAEFAAVLARMRREGSTLGELIRLAWDGDPLGSLTKHAPLTATGHHITIIGHITALELRRRLSVTDAGNGFLNRFLLVCTRRARVLPEGGALEPRVQDELAAALERALAFGRRHGEMPRDPPTKALWSEVYPELTSGRPGLLGATTSRGAPYVLRLALLYAMLEHSEAIRRPHLEAALACWRHSEASALYLFGDTYGDRDADRLLAALRAASAGLSMTEISGLWDRNKPAAEIRVLLSILEEHGMAKQVPPLPGRPGRPEERWRALGGTKETKIWADDEVSSFSSWTDDYEPEGRLAIQEEGA
jgi:hypothetical protein